MAAQTGNVTDIVSAAVSTVSTTSTPVTAVQSSLVTFQGVTITVDRLTDDPKTKAEDWQLSATLTYITTSPVPITYSEKFTGTYDQAIAKATDRVRELASLKAAHDSIHIRINAMSAGTA